MLSKALQPKVLTKWGVCREKGGIELDREVGDPAPSVGPSNGDFPATSCCVLSAQETPECEADPCSQPLPHF